MEPAISFTPRDFARSLAKNPRIKLPEQTRLRLDTTLRTIGIKPLDQEASDFTTQPDVVRFRALLEDAPRAADVVAAWRQVLDEDLQTSVAEAVLLEAYFSAGASTIASSLPSGLRYLKTLQVIRERTSIALHDYARDINWRRPVLFVQTLKVARGYLRDVVRHAELTREAHRQEFTGRLGVTTVLIGRFEPLDRREADEAVGSILLSLDQGNSPDRAVPYLLEAATLRFDTGGEVAQLATDLQLAHRFLPSPQFELNAAVQLAACDVHLRLAAGTNGQVRESALAAARLSIDAAVARARDVDQKVGARMMAVVVAALEADVSLFDSHQIAGLRLPFGLRTSTETPPLVGQLTAELVGSLADLASSGDPLARGVCADLLELTQASGSDPAALIRIIEFRAGNRRHGALSDERSRLLSLRDRLLIASAKFDAVERGELIKELILMSVAAPTSASPILLLAQDIEANGPAGTLSRSGGNGSEVARAAVTGDWRELMGMAARRAAQSPDLSVIPMGGRSGVTTVGDYYGLIGQTFVFKEVQALVLAREQPRAEALRAGIEAAGRSDEFLICEHLDAVPLSDQTVRSVRRFIPGRPVSIAATAVARDDRIDLLAKTAGYLGFLNTLEVADPAGVRKELKAKEVGRWIRALGVPNPLEHFDAWWQLVAGAGMTRRRDAHLDNWVVTADNRLLALDLEAIGCRPVGYELAQITDDAVLLDPTDWDGRRTVFDSYLIARSGARGDRDVEWAAYEASLAARAVGKLTWSHSNPSQQEHARALLEELATGASTTELQEWSRGSLHAWRVHRGLADLSSGELNMDPHRRRRISKAMAYHLRHGDVVTVDPDGWASLSELATAIGLGVRETEIAIVASTLSEPRFEFRDNLVRARYGHSRRVPRLLRSASALATSESAYHATGLESAHRIIELGEGLRPMDRQLVHLSKSRSDAIRSGLRHGAPILLSASASKIEGIMVAAGNTLVAPAVASSALRIEPVSTYWDLVPAIDFTGSSTL